ACSGSSTSTSDSDGGSAGGVEMAADSEDSDQSDAREVVVTGSLSLAAPDPLGAIEEVVRLVESVGGRVEERGEQAATDGQEAHGWLTVRVPAAELTPTLDGVKALGRASDVSLSS